MLLCAVACPRYCQHKKSYSDSTIGIWTFIEMFQAQRRSQNRPAGTVTKDGYQDF